MNVSVKNMETLTRGKLPLLLYPENIVGVRVKAKAPSEDPPGEIFVSLEAQPD